MSFHFIVFLLEVVRGLVGDVGLPDSPHAQIPNVCSRSRGVRVAQTVDLAGGQVDCRGAKREPSPCMSSRAMRYLGFRLKKGKRLLKSSLISIGFSWMELYLRTKLSRTALFVLFRNGFSIHCLWRLFG